MQTVTDSDIRKDLTLDGDVFNINVAGRFNVYIKREKVGYVVEVWVGDTFIDTTMLWDYVINDMMDDENAD